MLPGIRILFALVVLSFAMLVFGFGALSLLRSAHQHLASQPAWQQDWRTPVEIANARRDDHGPPAGETQTLALLRVDPPAKQPDATPAQPQPQKAEGEKPPVDGAADVSASAPPVTSASIAETIDRDRSVTADATSEAVPPGEKTVDQTMTLAPPIDDPGKVVVSSPPKVADLQSPTNNQVANNQAENDQVAQPATGTDASTAPAKASDGESPHDVGGAVSSPAKPEVSIKLAALPDATAASNEPRRQVGQQSAKPSDAADLRAKRRARARLRARRLAYARARAARLAQTQQSTNSSYYNSNFTTTGSSATGTTTNATPFGAPRAAP